MYIASDVQVWLLHLWMGDFMCILMIIYVFVKYVFVSKSQRLSLPKCFSQ